MDSYNLLPESLLLQIQDCDNSDLNFDLDSNFQVSSLTNNSNKKIRNRIMTKIIEQS